MNVTIIEGKRLSEARTAAYNYIIKMYIEREIKNGNSNLCKSIDGRTSEEGF
ncbi:hypothetical protein SAMN04487866_105115 [Thermoactinomyces sp. DSM 45891]|uniref:hypothetical protein n=1 Tax=Thermoactinomyces sp. DSM 45891 TaxID=1761907 RepID=UPI000921FBE6|nr:hypothetical protein [Thermoactinomyces sp. DSM 45891]SFX35619.1 hypothetical protein SAMN04487866_105115 [Thermoactinomyces sp. DSM 45891]